MQRRGSRQSGINHAVAEPSNRAARVHEDAELTAAQEVPNMALLVVLYMMQGVPLGLTMGSMPFILSSKASYTQIGIFSIAGYPYSFKLLWSPIVDSVYSSTFGRRKSWIVPLQLASAVLMIAFAPWANERLEAADVQSITLLFFFLVLLAATQDIAVDGWALTLLSRRHVGYASTCQTVGMNVGYFTSFTVFLALNDADFCNAYFRPAGAASNRGLLSLSAYLTAWGVIYVIITLAVWALKRERFHSHPAPRNGARNRHEKADAPSSEWEGRDGERDDDEEVGLREAYAQLWGVVKLPAVRRLAFVLVTSRLAMLPAESVAPLKLLEKGVSKEALAGLVLLEFPCELVSAVLAGRWATTSSPLTPWQLGYTVRLVMAALTTLIVHLFPSNASSLSEHPLEFFALAAVGLLTSFTSTLMFTSMGSFYNRISDPSMGGAYLTLLNTIANMGIILPKLGAFALIDLLSHNDCRDTDGSPLELDCPQNIQAARQSNECTRGGGVCHVARDGFYVASFASICLGVMLLLHYRRYLSALESLPVDSWRDKSLQHRS